MGAENFIVSYVRACGSGNLPFSECGPVWQISIIAVLLLAAVAVLVVLSFQDHAKPSGT
jgi:maltodextrin utilization protein YvdJ